MQLVQPKIDDFCAIREKTTVPNNASALALQHSVTINYILSYYCRAQLQYSNQVCNRHDILHYKQSTNIV